MAPGNPVREKSENNKRRKNFRKKERKKLQKFTKVVLGYVKSTEKT